MKRKLKEIKIKYVGCHPKARVVSLGDFAKGKEISFIVPEKVTIEAAPGKALKFLTLDFPQGHWLETWRAINGLRTDSNFSITDIFHEETTVREQKILKKEVK